MDRDYHHPGEGLPSADRSTGELQAASETLMEWHVHLAARQPARALVLLVIVGAAAGLAYAAFGHPLWSLLTLAALLGSVSDFVFPVTYRLTAEGAERRSGLGRSFLAWSDLRRCYPGAEGMKLSPLPAPSRLEAFRGIYLRWPEDAAARARLMETLRVRCPREWSDTTAGGRGSRRAGLPRDSTARQEPRPPVASPHETEVRDDAG